MALNRTWKLSAGPFVAIAMVAFAPAPAMAHCDGLDGPVVQAAVRALEAGDPALALIWVQPADEAEIRRAFADTLAVRGLDTRAKALADRYFFETLVRVHRAGEGAPYTGLQPAGRDLGPAIPAADTAVANGSLDPVAKLLTGAVQKGLREHFAEVVEARGFRPADLARGREYVRAYVQFIHFVERIYEASAGAAPSHDKAGKAPAADH